MTPKQAYDQIAARSRRMLRFHDGLVNVRQRGMRQDWKAAFCSIMHWPLAAQIDRIDSKDALIVLRNGANLSATDFTREAVDDLLRSALAIGVGALDRYVHERVCKGIVKALRTAKPSGTQQKLTVSALLALRMSETLRKAAKGGESVRPANQFRIAFQDGLHRRTFQSSSELDEGFRMIGIDGLWGELQNKYHAAEIKPVRDQLDGIARRRNWIVHEGDLIRHQRGGKPRLNAITKQYVHDSLDFLDKLVGHLESV